MSGSGESQRCTAIQPFWTQKVRKIGSGEKSVRNSSLSLTDHMSSTKRVDFPYELLIRTTKGSLHSAAQKKCDRDIVNRSRATRVLLYVSAQLLLESRDENLTQPDLLLTESECLPWFEEKHVEGCGESQGGAQTAEVSGSGGPRPSDSPSRGWFKRRRRDHLKKAGIVLVLDGLV